MTIRPLAATPSSDLLFAKEACRNAKKSANVESVEQRDLGEAVADAAHGFDVVAGRAHFLAQAFHVRVDGAGRDFGVDTPDLVEERAARLHAIAALVQRDQELELEGGELDLLALDPDAVGRAIDAQIAELDVRAVARG